MASGHVLASRSADRLAVLVRQIYGTNPFYTRKFDAAGIDPAAVVFPRDLATLPLTTKRELIDDQADLSPMGNEPERARRSIHPLQPDILDNRKATAVGGHERELAVDARVLEDGLRRRACRRPRSDFLSVLVRAVSRLLDCVRGGLPDWRTLYSRRRHVEPGALVDDRNAATHGHLLHAHVRAPIARRCGRDARPRGGSFRKLGAHVDRSRRARRQHRVDAETD